ncbi:MAG: phospho-N-acetylmuramoyl-pentapeptide-transferase [Phycisphaeraceae bacterium]
MFYLLVNTFREAIARHDWLGPLRLFDYIEFRAVLAIILSCAIVLAFGKRTIHWLLKQKIGDNPEFYHKDLNQMMKQKANTPTMGGLLIIGSILATVVLLADLSSFYVIMALICTVWLFGVGLADDWLKLTSARRKPGSREGLYTWEKLVFQLGLAVVLGLFIYHHGESKYTFEEFAEIQRMSHGLTLPFVKSWVSVEGQYVPTEPLIEMGRWGFVLLSVIVIAGFSNAVNLTDGMDGLASGVMGVVAFAFLVLCIIAGFTRVMPHLGGEVVLAKYLLVPYVPLSDELAVVAGAMAGACVGFLWFNCSPAQVFMGDSGSLPLGGLIGYIAVVVRQEFLLLLIGAVFVMEAGSVMLQVGYFKLSGGKRIFKCAPIHHHFHLLGWTEQQVVVRFWLLTIICAAAALATIKLR